MLHQKLREDLKGAMRARDSMRLTVLRWLLSAFTNENVAKKRKPDEVLPDEDVLAVLTRSAKQRKDSIEQFVKGGRSDLVAQETKELAIIQTYLPTPMSQDEIRPLAKAKQTELALTDSSKKGSLMSALMRELKGKADGNDVKAVVDSLFID